MEQHTSKVETWDKVSESYLEEITDSEEEIGKQLADLIYRLCPDKKEISAIELGAGSGHLSALLAERGIQTTLLDFSEKALERAKKVYEEHGVEGDWICQDLFALDIHGAFDIVWNSGVMEHFTDWELDRIIQNVRKLDAKYFILIVPNAELLPYLLYRYHMEVKNAWIWGREFLRTDYVERFEQAGFQMQTCFYTGKKYTEYTLNEALKRKFPYSEWIECHMAQQQNHSLVGFVFSYGEAGKDMFRPDRGEDSSVELKTKILELRSRLDYAGDVVYALGLQRDALEQEKQELVACKEEKQALAAKLECINAEANALQQELNICKCHLEEKNALLQEMEVKKKKRLWLLKWLQNVRRRK